MSIASDIEKEVGTKASRVSGYCKVLAKTADNQGTLEGKHSTSTVNANINISDVASLIGRESVFEKNFARQTYYVHKELIKAIDEMATKGGKGAKTKLINEALQEYISAKRSE